MDHSSVWLNYITDRGRPAHVLLTIADYRKLLGTQRSFLDVVAQEEDDEIEFDPPRMGDAIPAGRLRLTFLVDTNVWSELRIPARANANVRAWAAVVPEGALYLSAATVFELERGVLLMERCDARQGARLRGWLNEHVLGPFARHILPMDAGIARRCASLHVPDTRPARDALIAATALVHRLTVVTRNVADFEPMDVPVLNPWLEV